jgi:hypothetical protein
MAGGPEALCGDGHSDLTFFLRTLFGRAVATSTYVERDFARLSAWTRHAPQGIASLGAKHVCETLAAVARRHRGQAQAPGAKAREMPRTAGRPKWMKPRRHRGSCVTGMHLYQREVHPGAPLQESQRAWAALSPEEQEHWRERAKGRRAAAVVAAATDLRLAEAPSTEAAGGGPWGLWSSSGPAPLSRHVLARALQEPAAFRRLSDTWQQDGLAPLARSLAAGLAFLKPQRRFAKFSVSASLALGQAARSCGRGFSELPFSLWCVRLHGTVGPSCHVLRSHARASTAFCWGTYSRTRRFS